MHQLFQIDEQRAFLVSKDGYVAQVSYDRSPLPFVFCGCYEPTGTLREGYDPELDRLSAEQVAERYPRLWTLKESCMILAMACYAIIVLLLAAAPFVIRRSRASSPGAP